MTQEGRRKTDGPPGDQPLVGGPLGHGLSGTRAPAPLLLRGRGNLIEVRVRIRIRVPPRAERCNHPETHSDSFRVSDEDEKELNTPRKELKRKLRIKLPVKCCETLEFPESASSQPGHDMYTRFS